MEISNCSEMSYTTFSSRVTRRCAFPRFMNFNLNGLKLQRPRFSKFKFQFIFGNGLKFHSSGIFATEVSDQFSPKKKGFKTFWFIIRRKMSERGEKWEFPFIYYRRLPLFSWRRGQKERSGRVFLLFRRIQPWTPFMEALAVWLFQRHKWGEKIATEFPLLCQSAVFYFQFSAQFCERLKRAHNRPL